MCKNFFRNLSLKWLVIIFFIPMLFVFTLHDRIHITSCEIIITAFSIILVTNITALFAIPRETLKLLIDNDKTKYGDTLYSILINRYKFAIYTSFFFITFMILSENIKFGKKYIIATPLVQYIICYFTLLLLLFNIFLIRYYFQALFISLTNDKIK